MTEFMSRRERREAEQRGEIATPDSRSSAVSQPQTIMLTDAPSQRPPQGVLPVFPGAVGIQSQQSGASLPSRRELRLQQGAGFVSPPTPTERVSQPARVNPPVPQTLPKLPDTPKVVVPAQLPEVSLSSQVSVVEQAKFNDPVFRAEPSTNSIILDRVPDAVGVPLDTTGEILSTGSITILTEPTDTVLTGPLDDRRLDSISANEAVTGAITVVEPVSAIEVIRNKPHQTVMPSRGLRPGWWKPLLFAIATAGMIAAAVIAALVIIEALGI